MNTTNDINLTVTRFIKAPRQRVFDAWITPELLMRWWGPGQCHALSAKIDARVGGEYAIKMKTMNQSEATAKGVYREVTPPSRLAFTWSWENNDELAGAETLVTVEFEETKGGTHVTVKHEGFSSAEERDNHQFGWNGALDKLMIRAEVTAEDCATPGCFNWNELQTTDVPGAEAFYTQLFGWTAVPMPGGMPYTIFKHKGMDAGGLMQAPAKNGPGKPMWVPYVTVENADKSVAVATSLGAKIIAPAFDIPKVGRIAVLLDPQGATIGVFQPPCE